MGMTQQYLKTILDYNLETGIFIRKSSYHKNRIGKVAGGLMKNGYINITLYYKHYYAHRLAWFWVTGKWPKNQIDHINNKRDDNRWCNLREANQTQNNGNSLLSRKNTSGYRGISWCEARKKWQVGIHINNKRKALGRYKNLKDAIKVYNKAAIKHFGEYATLNEVDNG